jgi:aspartate/methionine/tyrosine aminotransferase
MLVSIESNVVPMSQNHKPSYRSVLNALSPNQGAEMLRYGWTKPGILSLGQGEGSLKTPDFITEAASRAMAEGKTFYAPVLGVPEFRQEIANYYTRIYGLSLPTNRIFATTSGTTAIHLALTAVLDEGDEVVAVTPIWKNLLGAIELAQAKTIQVPLEEDQGRGWHLDLDRLFDAVTHKTKAILIVTPSNPTGWVMPREQIKAVQEFARLRGIWIIADEVYGRIVYEGVHAPSFLETAQDDDRLFTVNSFSKSYAMTGWRLGWLVGPACAETKIRDIALYDNMGPPTFAQYGGIAALRYGEDFIAQQIDVWRANRDMVMQRFSEIPGAHLSVPQSTFYGFFTVDGEPDCLAFARRLIDEQGLSLAPGCAFGKTCAGYLRLVFAVSRDTLQTALDRLSDGIGG